MAATGFGPGGISHQAKLLLAARNRATDSDQPDWGRCIDRRLNTVYFYSLYKLPVVTSVVSQTADSQDKSDTGDKTGSCEANGPRATSRHRSRLRSSGNWSVRPSTTSNCRCASARSNSWRARTRGIRTRFGTNYPRSWERTSRNVAMNSSQCTTLKARE